MMHEFYVASWVAGVILVFTFSGTGCIARTEGCLDPGASNYDLEAERACGECCNYPPISIEWSPKWGQANFNVQDTLQDREGRRYFIRDIRFLAEAWQWTDAGGQLYTADSTILMCGDDRIPWLADYNLVLPTQFLYAFGTIREFPEVAAVRFSLGSERDFGCLEASGDAPAYLTASGSLRDPSTDSQAALRLVIQPDIFSELTDTVFLHGTINLVVPYSTSFERGRPARIRLTADYALWFSSASVTDPASFQASWEAGVIGSVTATP